MRILIAEFAQESNTFSVERTSFEKFMPNGARYGQELIEVYTGTPGYVGGMLAAAQKYGAEVVPTISGASAGSVLTRDCVEQMLAPILEGLRENAGRLDGVCLALHGAGCAEGEPDLEGYTLRRVREVCGDELPITVCLDLHCNLSPEMFALAQGLFGVKEYPHIDCDKAGYAAFETLVRMIKSGKKPNMAAVKLPLLLPPNACSTFLEPMHSILQHFRAYVHEFGLIDATLFHGFPYADTSDTGASVVVVSETDAAKHAEALARYVFDRRDTLLPRGVPAAQAVTDAMQLCGEGYVVINESSDNPGGGAPGDGTHLLAALLAQPDLPKTIFGFLFDPAAAAFLHEHAVGERVSFSLGGKTDEMHGKPVQIENARICALSDGEMTMVSPMYAGIPRSLGKTARVRVGTLDIVIGSVRTQTVDDRPCFVTGADITQYRIVALKSTHHFRGFFQSRAAHIVTADPPGIHCGDLSVFSYQTLPTRQYPLDRTVSYCDVLWTCEK